MDNFGTLFQATDDGDECCYTNWELFGYKLSSKAANVLSVYLDDLEHEIICNPSFQKNGQILFRFTTGLGTNPQYVGKMGLRPLNNLVVWSEEVEIHDDFKGQGAGQLLLLMRITMCREFGFKHYWCSVSADNVRQQHILTKYGFVCDDETRIWKLKL